MAVAHYCRGGGQVSKTMRVPKAVTKLEHWYKEVKRVIPDVPSFELVREVRPTVSHIWFIFPKEGGRIHEVVIDRKRPLIGM